MDAERLKLFRIASIRADFEVSLFGEIERKRPKGFWKFDFCGETAIPAKSVLGRARRKRLAPASGTWPPNAGRG